MAVSSHYICILICLKHCANFPMAELAICFSIMRNAENVYHTRTLLLEILLIFVTANDFGRYAIHI